MAYTYLATHEDIELIKSSIRYIFDERLSLIFKGKSTFQRFFILSYDSRYIYCWTTEVLKNKHSKIKIKNKDIFFYVIPHKLQITEDDRRGWHASFMLQELINVLPKNILDDPELPKASGSLVGDFISSQKETGNKYNPYTTKESYVATIIHEFGHLYYHQTSPSLKNRYLQILTDARKILKNEGDDINKPYIPLVSPVESFNLYSEVYAMCCEIYVSALLFKEHKKKLDYFLLNSMEDLIETGEKNANPFLLYEQNFHVAAGAIGKIFMYLYPLSWPKVIINYPTYFPKGH